MSQAQQGNPADQAFDLLYQQVHSPVFFNKLARDFGVVPKTQQEQLDLLMMGGQLRTSYEAELTKQAAGGSQYGRFNAELSEHLAQSGLQEPSQDLDRYKAASEAANHPDIANAVLTLQLAATEAAQQVA